MTNSTESSNTKPGETTLFAVERTRLAYDRTLMAWIRTATSLITFGFTVYKFFQLERRDSVPAGQLIGPREFALTMISIGLIALILATLEHRKNLQTLRADYPNVPVRTLARVISALISMLAILALLVVFLRK